MPDIAPSRAKGEPLNDIDDIVVGRLDPDLQARLVTALDAVIAEAPFFQPRMPRWGTKLSVVMSNCGPLGWVADKKGYRYQPTHPDTGRPWPPMPQILGELWAKWAQYPAPPEACLINYYAPGARMGLHQDKDEADFAAPVFSISLGDTARFALGGLQRQEPVRRFELQSGDMMVLRGARRLAFHGVERILGGTSPLGMHPRPLFGDGGRINLTLRRVNPLSL